MFVISTSYELLKGLVSFLRLTRGGNSFFSAAAIASLGEGLVGEIKERLSSLLTMLHRGVFRKCLPALNAYADDVSGL